MAEQRFNLLREPCIPVVGKGRVSLLGVFEDKTLTALSGTPLQKIALMKFLLAIAQAAATPADMDEWLKLGPDGLAEKCIIYLKAHEDCFWLYGPRPFLQMPACEDAKVKPFGTALPWVATGNKTRLTDRELEQELDDADKFLLILLQMSLCFGGKKADNKMVLTPGYEKQISAKPGPSLGKSGILHSFILGKDLIASLWLNLFTSEDIAGQKQWPAGVGIPPWENMPKGESCTVADELKSSLMGRLIPMARFCLLTDMGLKFTEGIIHHDHSVGMIDLSASASVDKEGKWQLLHADTEKRPWRELPALLSFLSAENASGYYSLGIHRGIIRAKRAYKNNILDSVCIWSAGVQVSDKSGEQYITGKDDELQSEIWLHMSCINDIFYTEFSGAIKRLEILDSLLKDKINDYYAPKEEKKEKRKGKTPHAKEASNLFWQMAERTLQELIAACDHESEGWTEDSLPALLRRYRAMVLSVYDESCPHDTARQFETWVCNRPFSGRKHG